VGKSKRGPRQTSRGAWWGRRQFEEGGPRAPAVALCRGGPTPALGRRRGLAGEVQDGERNPFRGSIGAEEGRRRELSMERISPAAMALLCRAGGPPAR